MGNIIFFNVQSFKYEFLWKILDIQLYNIVRNWYSTKNWIFANFFKKVSIDGFSHYLWGILFFIMFKVSNMKFYHFPQKIGFLRFFLRKFLLTVFHIIYGEYYFFNVQSFKYEILSKILDIQLCNIVRHWFSTENWIFAIFFKKVSIDGFSHYLWGILFFLLSKVSKMKFDQKSLI